MERGEIRIKNETLAVLSNYCLTRGVPLPPGQVRSPAGVSIRDAKGRVVPSEGRILQKRPDGSVEWMALDILLNLKGQESTHLYIEPRKAAAPAVKHPVTVRETGGRVVLSNGLSEVVINRAGGSLIHRMTINGREIVKEGTLVDLQVVDPGGKIYRASLNGRYKVTIPYRNRIRTEVKIEGKHVARDGESLLDFALRFTLTAGNPDLKLEHTFYCHEPKEGRISVKAIRLVIPTTMDPASHKLVRQNHHSEDWFYRDLDIAENMDVVASSVADVDSYAQNYKGPTASHPCAGGNVFLRNVNSLHENWSEYPFHMRPGQGSGFRADIGTGSFQAITPIIGWKQKDYTLVTTFEHFRQLHPKSITIDESELTYSIWPEWSVPMQVVQGVSKSHIFWITGERRALDMDDVIDVLGRWEYGYVEPIDVSFDPAWPAFCEVLECQHFLKYQPEKYPMLENLIEPATAAGNPARHTYDRLAAIGMFHFGDHVSPDGTSCSNNEDDIAVLFPLQHFLRTGHTYAWDHGRETTRHYMEVDFCEWSTWPRQHGGLIPHTGQHFVGCVYPSHQWAEGILTYYYLTGDERARQVVIACGDNYVYWTYHKLDTMVCDGREAGMPLVNMAAAYRLTRDPKYIKASRLIIRSFFTKWLRKYGEFKYPYPQGTQKHPHKLITGYGDWSSFAGLYRLWELTGEAEFKDLAVKLLKQCIKPGSFSLNDARGMDFFAAWMLGRMTGDMESVIETVKSAVPMLLRRGGHPIRRLHFLKELDERGMIDDRFVGSRGGVI
ncbi:MAG: hypothetical protein A2498_09265 [Lentisphaerae bacterium RIFOXYC12_FULL_60_16]|nr:MAG: hypothetical protein A2498_09265 [Lentisphaerae bacterium RIFOXYC12_FULL_60_16]